MDMGKKRRLKYRWVLLFALSVWFALTLAIALGTAKREGVTATFAFVPLAIILVALAPISVPRIVEHRWFLPISSIWGCGTIVIIHLIGSRLLGYGHQCDRVVIFASLGGYGTLVTIWIVAKFYRWMRTLIHRKFVPDGENIQIKAEIV